MGYIPCKAIPPLPCLPRLCVGVRSLREQWGQGRIKVTPQGTVAEAGGGQQLLSRCPFGCWRWLAALLHLYPTLQRAGMCRKVVPVR